MNEDLTANKKYGATPVFFTALSTILGAILFLRFGYAVGMLGIWGVMAIVVMGHLVIIPTTLAISELATNKRVEGGGVYFIISRSFGLNIGATIGITLYLSQAISVAFYVIAFTEAFGFFFDWFIGQYGFELPKQVVSLPATVVLMLLILRSGANLGFKTLYVVVAVLGISLLLFFLGDGLTSVAGRSFISDNAVFRRPEYFFQLFAVIFPAFTGMTAGVGLSGDLKEPGKSIPLGIISATLVGMLIYIVVSIKFGAAAPEAELIDDQLIMSRIAIAGTWIIPIGLAASTISSALGSIIVAPRTLQALAVDQAFPSEQINQWLGKTRTRDNEPVNATLITTVLALFFVMLGSIDAVAEIISMFFMITYGALCLISFLNHFGSPPSYRPKFRSKWYISLFGFIATIGIMYAINAVYTTAAILLIIIVYLYINSYHQSRKGISSIFTNAIFQMNKSIQVFLQNRSSSILATEWRPSVICISTSTFKRDLPLRFLNWISYKYGFGTYLHRINGYYSKQTYQQAREDLQLLINSVGRNDHTFIDTIISPSFTSAIAQAIQLPGSSGMENNIVLFEYDKEQEEGLPEIVENFKLVHAGDFDVCILATSNKLKRYRKGIHIWIKSVDDTNANLMILLGFILMAHPDWRNTNIKIYNICYEGEVSQVRSNMDQLIRAGRLPISSRNVEIIYHQKDQSLKTLINDYSSHAALTIVGFRTESILHHKAELFAGYDEIGDMLFVNSAGFKQIE